MDKYVNGSVLCDDKWIRTFVIQILACVMLFDDVVDVGHGRADKECKYECDNVVLFALPSLLTRCR
jgi:hypothetical protein